MELFQQVRKIISDTIGVPLLKITRETSNVDFGAWDSFAHVELMISLEQTFDISLEVEDLAKLTSVRAILEYLETHRET